jgi:glycosyltransferase involved in cell wall biosynthesis
LKRDGIAIYHGLSQELPIGIRQSGIRSVVTIHDLIYKRFPKYFGLISRNIYAAKANYACANADKVIAISQKTKADLIELLKVDPAKIEVIYQGCNAIFKVKQTAQKKAEIHPLYRHH